MLPRVRQTYKIGMNFSKLAQQRRKSLSRCHMYGCWFSVVHKFVFLFTLQFYVLLWIFILISNRNLNTGNTTRSMLQVASCACAGRSPVAVLRHPLSFCSTCSATIRDDSTRYSDEIIWTFTRNTDFADYCNFVGIKDLYFIFFKLSVLKKVKFTDVVFVLSIIICKVLNIAVWCLQVKIITIIMSQITRSRK